MALIEIIKFPYFQFQQVVKARNMKAHPQRTSLRIILVKAKLIGLREEDLPVKSRETFHNALSAFGKNKITALMNILRK